MNFPAAHCAVPATLVALLQAVRSAVSRTRLRSMPVFTTGASLLQRKFKSIPPRTIVPWLAADLLAGCVAGPDFRPPAPTQVSSYKAGPLPAQTASAATTQGDSQRFETGGDVEPRWWRNLDSSELDALIEQAFASNPSLAAARATWRQAQELQHAEAGSTRYPVLDGNTMAQRQRRNPNVLARQGMPGNSASITPASACVIGWTCPVATRVRWNRWPPGPNIGATNWMARI